jgi:hypothetical protein
MKDKQPLLFEAVTQISTSQKQEQKEKRAT